MQTSHQLSTFTVDALDVQSGDYVSKDRDELAHIEQIKQQNGLDKVYRFDIGKNTDGFSPRIRDALTMPEFREGVVEFTEDYPDNHYSTLRGLLSLRYDLPSEWFVLSAGLESIIDHIARAVFNPGDAYLLPVPNFSVFEDMSRRMKARPMLVPLGDDLQWTFATTDRIVREMAVARPKLLWISNPVNPTGQHIGLEHLRQIVDAGRRYGVLIVVDEAYGEYSDRDDKCVSAASMIRNTPHLMVLRTFSKMYGLPGTRVGYMMCSSPELRQAVNFYRPMFPFSWFSLHLAQIAIMDEAYVRYSRERVARRRQYFYRDVSEFKQFQFLPTQVNTVMFRHAGMGAGELSDILQRRGVLTANLDNVVGIEGQRYLRMTLRSCADNNVFIAACRQIEGTICL